MYHLIYTSKALCEFSGAELKKLLLRSRHRNGVVNVTGMLIYRDCAFLQALEGDRSTVHEVFERIEADARHSQVNILAERLSPDGHRLFGKWSMGFANATSNAQVLSGFVNLSAGQDLLTMSDKEAIAVLSSCGSQQYEAA